MSTVLPPGQYNESNNCYLGPCTVHTFSKISSKNFLDQNPDSGTLDHELDCHQNLNDWRLEFGPLSILLSHFSKICS